MLILNLIIVVYAMKKNKIMQDLIIHPISDINVKF